MIVYAPGFTGPGSPAPVKRIQVGALRRTLANCMVTSLVVCTKARFLELRQACPPTQRIPTLLNYIRKPALFA